MQELELDPRLSHFMQEMQKEVYYLLKHVHLGVSNARVQVERADFNFQLGIGTQADLDAARERLQQASKGYAELKKLTEERIQEVKEFERKHPNDAARLTAGFGL